MDPVFKQRRRLRTEDLDQITRVLGAVPERILRQIGDSLTVAPAPPPSGGSQREAMLNRFEESRQRIREAIARRSALGPKAKGGGTEGR